MKIGKFFPQVLQISLVLSSIEILVPNRWASGNVLNKLVHIQIGKRCERGKMNAKIYYFLSASLLTDSVLFLFFLFISTRETEAKSSI
jgi:hypothetical protein